jgi:hypothetical protein
MRLLYSNLKLTQANLLILKRGCYSRQEEGWDMVKPPPRRKSIGFKVSEEEYAQLETAARTSGRTLGEWCREVVLASASEADRRDPALAEILGVRLLLVNVLGPVAAGEKVTAERFNQLLDQISEMKHQLAAQLQRQATSKKVQREKPSSDGKR